MDPSGSPHRRRRPCARTGPRAGLVAAALLALTTACSLTGGSGEKAGDTSPGSDASTPDEVVLVTHESFTLPDELTQQFTAQTGFELTVRAQGDAGQLASKLALTSDSPTGDVAFGVDTTFASRTLQEDVFAEYAPDLPPGAEQYALAQGSDRLTPVDHGDVCVNVDTTWFRERGQEPPQDFADLTDPAYSGLFVTPGADTSSPGLAFLLATIASQGEDWQQYWRDLMSNGTRLTSGWSDAYYVEFTQGGEDGERPVVLSYASSPAFTVPSGGGESTTRALLDTCFRQVEYAGVLAGAENPEGARALIDFLLSREVQAALPQSMYVHPVRSDVDLPADWSEHTRQPDDPITMDPERIAEQRAEWLRQWRDITTG